jgi:hypothetical protein
VQVLSLLFAWGKPRGWLKRMAGNPAADVPKIRRPKTLARANRPWKPEEREAVFAAIKEKVPQLLLPLTLARYTPLREGDVLIFPRSAYDGRNINTVMSKNGEPHWMPAPAPVRQLLDKIPKDHPSTIY